MIDPLAQAVTLLAPRASYSKTVTTAGAWRVRRAQGQGGAARERETGQEQREQRASTE